MKITHSILVIMLGISGMSFTNDQTQNLNEHMKSFRHRFDVYMNCINRTCSAEEWETVKGTIWKDGLLLFGAVALISGVGGIIYTAWPQIRRSVGVGYAPKELKKQVQALHEGDTETIMIDRHAMTVVKDGSTIKFTMLSTDKNIEYPKNFSEITALISTLKNEPNLKRIELHINKPGKLNISRWSRVSYGWKAESFSRRS